VWGVAKVLARRHWYTGEWTCQLNALDFAVGYTLIPKKLALTIAQNPLRFNALADSEVQKALSAAGVLLLRVKLTDTIGMATIMGQKEGTFLVCYNAKTKEKEGEDIGHCVTIDCLRRIAFCNQNGVYPFCLSAKKGPETADTHNNLRKRLGVRRITHVYRVLFRVDKPTAGAGETRVLRNCAKAPQPENKRQKQK
jgi:hypothetical protein